MRTLSLWDINVPITFHMCEEHEAYLKSLCSTITSAESARVKDNYKQAKNVEKWSKLKYYSYADNTYVAKKLAFPFR